MTFRDTETSRDTDARESEVRYYSRHAPQVFAAARGSLLQDEDGRSYIDFLSACGSLNYGHNPPTLTRAAIAHLEALGVIAGLDLKTPARQDFIRAFEEVILRPRGLDHRIQFPGPTGANAVEAALKLARKATGRRTVAAFTNAFHGVTLGALAATGNGGARSASAALLDGVVRLAYEGYMGAGTAELDRFAAMANDPSGGIEKPAAFIVETVQGEGGLNVASVRWLRRLAEVAAELGSLLIVDDIQAGCGRAGGFFSFERAGITPDIVCLSKSISGSGLPMALVLIRPQHDVWAPGEHNGTFRGNNLAFATATAALDFWRSDALRDNAAAASRTIAGWAEALVARRPYELARVKGVGLMIGIEFRDPKLAEAAARRALAHGVLIETAGPRGEVLKLMPALNIPQDLLAEGLARLALAIDEALPLEDDEPLDLVA